VISIGILEDNLELRQSIVDFLNLFDRYLVVFSFGAYSELQKEKIDVCPDVVLLDVHLLDIDSIDLIKSIKMRFDDVQIIVITGDKEKSILLASVEKGASAILYKPFHFAELESCIESVMKTGSYLKPEVLTKLFDIINKENEPVNKGDKQITGREAEVLRLVIMGMTYKEISSKMDISFHTVNHHLKNLYIKYGVNSKSELIVKCIGSKGIK